MLGGEAHTTESYRGSGLAGLAPSQGEVVGGRGMGHGVKATDATSTLANIPCPSASGLYSHDKKAMFWGVKSVFLIWGVKVVSTGVQHSIKNGPNQI